MQLKTDKTLHHSVVRGSSWQLNPATSSHATMAAAVGKHDSDSAQTNGSGVNFYLDTPALVKFIAAQFESTAPTDCSDSPKTICSRRHGGPVPGVGTDVGVEAALIQADSK